MSVAIDSARRYLSEERYRWVGLLFVIGLLFLPMGVENYMVGLITKAIIFGLFAISVDIALGYTGLITLAPAAFFGIGAYSIAKLVVDYDASYWLGFPTAIVLAATIAFLIGYAPIKRRIGEVYFVLFTMAFGVIVHDFTFVTTSFTGGSNGLAYVSPPEVFGINLAETLPFYYFSLIVVGALVVGLYLLLRSDYGSILHASRQNELRMRYLGYDTDREKLLAWIISAVISAVAGAIYVGTVGVASPSLMEFALTGEVIIWVVVGGTGTFVGPFIAAFLLTLLEDYLGGVWSEGYLIILGVLFVAFIFLLPEGVMGRIQDRED
ncbi:branched-chain amino acid ABC transporter permease [Halobellus rubicundus]|uniref:Branched-chain amino acid ABC transporter permease n=1 Tax=Halobellus rubicundus TaxID=2996466 RepID=A0ABD5MEB8_9EURY